MRPISLNKSKEELQNDSNYKHTRKYEYARAHAKECEDHSKTLMKLSMANMIADNYAKAHKQARVVIVALSALLVGIAFIAVL